MSAAAVRPPPAPPPLLVARGLRKAFGGVVAVDGVDLRVVPGEMVALIGPNGAGKSTCFGLIEGTLAPDAGTLWLDDAPVTAAGPAALWRRGVGRTFQVTATFPSMTVRENVQTALASHRRRTFDLVRRADRLERERADALLAGVGLGGEAERPCSELAYGDLKRLELALALANDPRLLLMDEPTAGMAPAERRALMAVVRDRVDQGGLGVLFTEHDMDVVFAHADRVLVLDRGRPVAEGPPAVVRSHPEVKRVYLGDESHPAGGGSAR